MSDCVFCKIINGELAADLVLETKKLIVIEDIHKDAPEHMLVIPKQHLSNLNNCQPKDRQLLGDILLAAQAAAHKKGIHLSGYRCIINNNKNAGQIVAHLHLHVLGGKPLGRLVAKDLPEVS